MPTIPNLDALIKREDLDITVDPQPTSGIRNAITVSDLVRGSFFMNGLRKPDFQRETCDWSVEKICEFIRTFLDGELIPAVILWKSPGGTFIIDGAHRLSALIAWIHDDYGTGLMSAEQFSLDVLDEHRASAERTRRTITQEVGTYADYQALSAKPDPSRPIQNDRALRLGQIALDVQWVTGSSKEAERSFYRINLSATEIDATELSMIQARRKPNALATRAIVRAGSGHKYWSGFEAAVQNTIEKDARTIYDLLCNPPLQVPIRTSDVPAVGSGHDPDTVRLVFDLVNYLHGLREDMWVPQRRSPRSRSPVTPMLPDDDDGRATLEYLKRTKEITSRMIGEHRGSLGLHPLVYFYGATGKFQSTAFLAMVALVRDLEARGKFDEFTEVRKGFEQFLIQHRSFINLIGRHIGAGAKGLDHALTMYHMVLDGLAAGRSDAEIVQLIRSDARLSFIADPTDDDRKHGKNFSLETKSALFISQALRNQQTCGICGGLLHVRSISYDHIDRLQDGGTGEPENGQLTHPYCNSGYKERLNSSGKRSGPIKFGFKEKLERPLV